MFFSCFIVFVLYICIVNVLQKVNIMKTKQKQLITTTIKEIVLSNPEKQMILICGVFETRLSYTSRKEFGNKVLDFLSRENVTNIDFKGIEDNSLVFKVITENYTNSFGNGRGYGQGRYMGD